MESFLTVSEVAEQLRVSCYSVSGWCRDKSLVGYRIGKTWLIKPSDLNEFLSRRKSAKSSPKKNGGK